MDIPDGKFQELVIGIREQGAIKVHHAYIEVDTDNIKCVVVSLQSKYAEASIFGSDNIPAIQLEALPESLRLNTANLEKDTLIEFPTLVNWKVWTAVGGKNVIRICLVENLDIDEQAIISAARKHFSGKTFKIIIFKKQFHVLVDDRTLYSTMLLPSRSCVFKNAYQFILDAARKRFPCSDVEVVHGDEPVLIVDGTMTYEILYNLGKDIGFKFIE